MAPKKLFSADVEVTTTLPKVFHMEGLTKITPSVISLFVTKIHFLFPLQEGVWVPVRSIFLLNTFDVRALFSGRCEQTIGNSFGEIEATVQVKLLPILAKIRRDLASCAKISFLRQDLLW